MAAKRARQINSYYHNLGEGTFDEYPPPMVETTSKNYLRIALEEIAAGKIKYEYRVARRQGHRRHGQDPPRGTGGIAAYKAVELVRLATRAGHAVRVVQTPASLNFVGRATFAGDGRSGAGRGARARSHAGPTRGIRLRTTTRLPTSSWWRVRTFCAWRRPPRTPSPSWPEGTPTTS